MQLYQEITEHKKKTKFVLRHEESIAWIEYNVYI